MKNIRTQVDTATREKRYKIVIILLSVALLIAVGVSVLQMVFPVGTHSSTSQNSSTSSSVVRTQPSRSGKSVDQDRRDALAAAEALLKAGGTYNGKLSFNDRLTAVGKRTAGAADYTTMNKYLLFNGEFSDDTNLQNTVYQTLVTLNHFLTEGSNKIAPVSNTSYSQVYLDQEHGIAYVPVNALSSTSSVFSLEMIYDNGQWKLAPYTLLDMVRMSYTLNQK